MLRPGPIDPSKHFRAAGKCKHFRDAGKFDTHEFAHLLDSLARGPRRVGWTHAINKLSTTIFMFKPRSIDWSVVGGNIPASIFIMQTSSEPMNLRMCSTPWPVFQDGLDVFKYAHAHASFN